MHLNIIDIFILSIILLTGVLGLRFGIFRLVVPFALVLVITTILYNYNRISLGFENKPFVNVFLLLLIGFIGLLIFAVVARLAQAVMKTTGLAPLDHFLGLVLGLILGGLVVGATVWAIQTYNVEWKNLLRDSKVTIDALNFFKWIMAWTQKFLPTTPEVENIKAVPWWKRNLW